MINYEDLKKTLLKEYKSVCRKLKPNNLYLLREGSFPIRMNNNQLNWVVAITNDNIFHISEDYYLKWVDQPIFEDDIKDADYCHPKELEVYEILQLLIKIENLNLNKNRKS